MSQFTFPHDAISMEQALVDGLEGHDHEEEGGSAGALALRRFTAFLDDRDRALEAYLAHLTTAQPSLPTTRVGVSGNFAVATGTVGAGNVNVPWSQSPQNDLGLVPGSGITLPDAGDYLLSTSLGFAISSGGDNGVGVRQFNVGTHNFGDLAYQVIAANNGFLTAVTLTTVVQVQAGDQVFVSVGHTAGVSDNIWYFSPSSPQLSITRLQ